VTQEERDALKSIIREEPGLLDTLADLDVQVQPKEIDLAALLKKRCEVVAKLGAIEAAKEKLGAGPIVVVPCPEPQIDPAQEEFAVPELSVTESAKEDEDHGQS
jgi:hypothetical protein